MTVTDRPHDGERQFALHVFTGAVLSPCGATTRPVVDAAFGGGA